MLWETSATLYSLLRILTGFVLAAEIDWYPTVTNAITVMNNTEIRKVIAPISIRYANPFNHWSNK